MTHYKISSMPLKSSDTYIRAFAQLKPAFLRDFIGSCTAVFLLMASTADAQSLAISPPEFEAALGLNLQFAEAQDADFTNERDTGLAEIDLTLGVEQEFGERVSLVGRLEFSSSRFTRDSRNNDDEAAAYDLERLYLQFDPSKALRLRLGRQGLDDPMEAILDEDLDGIRLSFEAGNIELDISQTREDWFEASTAERVDVIENTYGILQVSPNKGTIWMPYVMHRSGEAFADTAKFDATWIGVQGIVEPKDSPWRYWLHGVVMDGQENDDDDKIDLGGQALQLGINWTMNHAWEPTFTLAVSQASGGERDERFRQAGLQGNDFALNDKTSFRYLGEVLDPELTNIRVITLGIGAEITKRWTADIAVHSYQQVEVEGNLRGSDIEYDPLGISDDLGVGADLIVSYEHDKQLDFLMTTGRFIPGEAFNEGRDDAWIARLEVEYSF